MGVIPTLSIAERSFAITANGAPDSPPASAVREYLLARGARLVTVFHPLGPEEEGRHELTRYDGAGGARRRRFRLPSKPPLTYPLDLLVPPALPRVDAILAFNNLLCAQGLVARRAGRAGRVVYWAVDFVPDRFGPGALTRAYDALDAYCCRAADGRLEVSEAALDGRNERHRLDARAAPAGVCPIGTWLARVPQVPENGHRAKTLVFIGHLVERMGAATAINAVRIMRERGVNVRLEIAGRGPLEDDLRASARDLGDSVVFHGFISDHRALENVLAGASIALAPYATTVESFTRFADPSKLKSYLGAALPILLTDVPPNASELERCAGAQVVADTPEAFADAATALLDDPTEWGRRRTLAAEYAGKFDWNRVLDDAFAVVGFAA